MIPPDLTPSIDSGAASDPSTYLAFDLGAESGRAILGTLQEGHLTLEEAHRFPNITVKLFDSLRWDLLHLFVEMKAGLRKAVALSPSIRSLSVDTWGVDYVYFNARQPMLSLPYCYRDARTDRTFESTVKELGAEAIFAETGIQFMFFNTLYQFRADLLDNQDTLKVADKFLCVADYFNHLFGGAPRAEASLASTTQVYNPATHAWSDPLIKMAGLPTHLFPQIVPSGTRLGNLHPDIAAEVGAPGSIEVVASCSHDTGAAIAAVPAVDGSGNPEKDWAYLVSGTWSLMGVELPSPLINEEVRAHNYTNEVGYGGSIRFLKNISGLWLLQEARRDYERQGPQYDYATIVKLAEEAGPAASFVHPDAARFARPGNMLKKMDDYLKETGQPLLDSPGQHFRCILESLALLYGKTLLEIEKLTDRSIRTLHIVGGGSQNRLLNQMTAEATGRRVLAGPVEGTAIGNVLVQALALGDIASLSELRSIVRHSFPVETYAPHNPVHWRQAALVFGGLDLLT